MACAGGGDRANRVDGTHLALGGGLPLPKLRREVRHLTHSLHYNQCLNRGIKSSIRIVKSSIVKFEPRRIHTLDEFASDALNFESPWYKFYRTGLNNPDGGL